MARNLFMIASTLGFSCFFFVISLTMAGMSSAEPAVQEEEHRAAFPQRTGAGAPLSGGLAGSCEPGWLQDIGQPGIADEVLATTVYDGSLVAGGLFTTAGGETVNRIARWDGEAWQPFTSGGQIGVNEAVLALTVYEGDLIAGGFFTTAGGQTVNSIARWDGAAWHPLMDGGSIGVNGGVRALTVNNGELIAGGGFTAAGGQGVNGIARWDGETWHPLTSGGLSGVAGTVFALTVYNGSLVIGGTFFTTASSETVNNIARWDGAAWHPFTSGSQTGVSGPVFALTVYNGSLVAGGQFTTAGGQTVNRITRWDGDAWHPLTSGNQIGVSSDTWALTVWNGDLVAGGLFPTAGGRTVNRIARWDGAVWHPFTSGGQTGVNEIVKSLTVYNGSLVAGGQFTTAGGETANRIALWKDCAEGACCINGVALGVPISESDCLAVGGDYQGDFIDPGQMTCSQTEPTCAGDLNNDGVVNVFDLLELLSNWGTCEVDDPTSTEGCGAPDTGSCFENNGTPYCDDADCCEAVCACDPFCCDTEWDALCAGNNDDGCGAAVVCNR